MVPLKYLFSAVINKVQNKLRRVMGTGLKFDKKNRSAFENFIRAKSERLSGEILVRSYPSYLYIDPSSICNLRCPSCPTGVENAAKNTGNRITFRNRTLMSVELFDSLMDEVGEYLFMVMFYNWGEPLLNKKLPYFIRKAKNFDIYTELHSSLSIKIADEFIESILNSGIDSICGSIDGFSQETYGTYRQGGNFGLAKDNILRFAATRDKLGADTKIVWNFLVFGFNEHEVEDAKKFCAQNGIIFTRKDAFINKDANPDWLPSYRKAEANKKPEKISVEPAPQKNSCGWHYSYSAVNADGSVSACCGPWEQAQDFGAVIPGKQKFADVWNNALFRKSRALHSSVQIKDLPAVKTVCEKCPFEGIKNHLAEFDQSVLARAKQLFPDLDLKI